MPAALGAPKRRPTRLRLSPSLQGPASQRAPPSRDSNGSAAAAGKRSPAPAAQPVAGAAAAATAAGPPAPPAAWAYQGAPRPPNEEERLALLRSLGVLDSEQGPDQFDAITRLLCAVFSVPIALVSLVDAGGSLAASGAALKLCRQLQAPLARLGRQLQAWQAAAVSHMPVIWAGLISLLHCPHAERQWFKSVQGLGTCIQTGRTESFCAWTLLPESPCMLVRHTERVSLAAWRCPKPLCWLPNAVVLCAAVPNHLRCPLYR